MRKTRYALLAIRALTVLSCVLVTIWAMTLPVKAEPAIPPPVKTPLPTATDTSEPSDTPAPSDTPRPTDTPIAATPTWMPSPTLMPTSTFTPAWTPRPADTSAPQPRPEKTSRPDPACLSVVEGIVTGGAGQGLAGATVIIQGSGWSNAMMTDDNGRFGFGGLCAGSASLQGTLPNRQLTAATTVSLDGKSGVDIELSTQTGGAAAPTQAAATATGQDAQPSPMPEPSMPITGYSGLLQVAGAILGTLLIVFAGARRLLSVRD